MRSHPDISAFSLNPPASADERAPSLLLHRASVVRCATVVLSDAPAGDLLCLDESPALSGPSGSSLVRGYFGRRGPADLTLADTSVTGDTPSLGVLSARRR